MYATHLRNEGHEIIWGNGFNNPFFGEPPAHLFNKVIKTDFDIELPFDQLPYPDRIFTDAKNPRWQSYGNYKFHPATHMMASNLCWYGKCTFCIDTAKLESGEKRGIRSVEHVIEEIDDLISKGYREVFDDSGTFPVGAWLEEFCKRMNEPYQHTSGGVTIAWLDKSGRRKSRKELITIGCNMKPIKLNYKMMANAGFRFILVGIESANQETIDRIKKGQRSEDVFEIIKSMSDAGLEPHGTFMTGYQWEKEKDELNTIRLCHNLLKKGYLKTAQVSVYSPPRTAPELSSPGHRYLPMFYDAYRSPEFWFHKINSIKKWEDFTYLIRGARLVIEEKWRKMCLNK